MEAPIGGGPIKSVEKAHFWKAFILFAIIIGGIWGWYYYKIRHDVKTQRTNTEVFNAQQR